MMTPIADWEELIKLRVIIPSAGLTNRTDKDIIMQINLEGNMTKTFGKLGVNLVVCFLLCNLTSLYAETIYLKSGEKIEAKITEKNDKEVWIKDEVGAPKIIMLNDVERIDEGASVATRANIPASPAMGNDLKEVLQKGKESFQAKKYDEAIVYLNKAIELDPGNYQIIFGAAAANYYLGRYSDAIVSLKQAISIQPNSPEAYFFLGVAYDAMGSQQEAKDALGKALEQYRFSGYGDGAVSILVDAFLKKIS